MRRWFSGGPARLRRRRRLLVLSAVPVALLAVLSALAVAVFVAGRSAPGHFREGEVTALGRDVAVLELAEPLARPAGRLAAGALAVADGRLDDADADYTGALAQVPFAQECAVRVDLELVRETQGDRARRAGDDARARERYAAALAVVTDAPPGCFADNTDPDPERRVVRADAAARLAAKTAILDEVPPPAPPSVPPAPPAAPPPPGGAAPSEPPVPPQRSLFPGGGDPYEQLRRLLTDAAQARVRGAGP